MQSSGALFNGQAVALEQSRTRTGPRPGTWSQILALDESVARIHADDDLDRHLIVLREWALWLLNQLGDSPARAILIGESLLAARERSRDPITPTLRSRNSLANAYWAAGRTSEAITLHEQTLAARERTLGPDHPDTLTSRSNLANAC